MIKSFKCSVQLQEIFSRWASRFISTATYQKGILFHGDKISIILVIVHYLSYHFHFLFWVNNYSDRHVQSYFNTSRTWTRFTTISPHCIRECGHRPFDAPKQTVASSYTTTQSARDWSTSLSGLSRLVKKAICKTHVKIYRFNGPFIHWFSVHFLRFYVGGGLKAAWRWGWGGSYPTERRCHWTASRRRRNHCDEQQRLQTFRAYRHDYQSQSSIIFGSGVRGDSNDVEPWW